MPAWLNIALTVFYVLWPCALLALLALIWRSGTRRSQKFEETVITTAFTNAATAKTSAEAAHMAAEAALLLAKMTGKPAVPATVVPSSSQS
jgi:hypothetical protein